MQSELRVRPVNSYMRDIFSNRGQMLVIGLLTPYERINFKDNKLISSQFCVDVLTFSALHFLRLEYCYHS